MVAKVVRVSTNVTFQEWQREFVAPLYRLARQAIGDPARMTAIQMELVRHIYPLQDARKEQAKEGRLARRDAGEAGRVRDLERQKSRAADARYHDTMREAAAFTIRELREIGDMLAWKTMHNRMRLRLMASKSPPGDLPPMSDYMATLKDAASEADQLRSWPLFTDTTNLLRHGDVLYIPWDGSRIVRIEELKASGGDPKRRERQERSIQELEDLLRTGTGPFAGRRYHLRDCRIPVRHHFSEVRDLIAKARADGRADAWLSRNHALTVVDFTDDSRIDALLARMPDGPTGDLLLEAEEGDDLYPSGLIPRIEDAMLPAAPWGVYPLPEKDRLDLASLGLCCASTLNLSGFIRDAAAAGLPTELVTDVPTKYAAIRSQLIPGMTNEIDITFFMVRIGVEFMDEDVLLDLLRYPALPPPPRDHLLMFEFTDEMKIWD